MSLDGQTRESTPIQVKFDASNRFTYWIRLSAPPVYRVGEQIIPWWVRIFVDGAVRIDGVYNGIRWTPSVGHEFNQDTWDQWRQVTFRIDSEAMAESLSIFHEVWATSQWCPLHNASPITLNVDGDTDDTDDTEAIDNTDDTDPNNPPEFPADTTDTLNLDETDCDVAPGSATDIDNDRLTYSLEGTDARYFTIDRNRGQIKTKPGVIYDFESRPTYTVTVKVSDRRDTDTIVVTINVEDLLEVPCKPCAPKVRLAKGGETGLSVSWKAPPNAGRPPITGYDLQYRTGPGRGLAGRPAGCRQHEHNHYDDRGFRRGIALALRGAGPGAEWRRRRSLVAARSAGHGDRGRCRPDFMDRPVRAHSGRLGVRCRDRAPGRRFRDTCFPGRHAH